jgi:membrane-associated phospholipid phosphatase
MTTQDALRSITNLGDLAVLIPLDLALFIWLFQMPLKIRAIWWAAAGSLCMGGTALLKLIFFICPIATDVQSPSGHTSLGTLVYGALVVLVAPRLEGWKR